MRRRRAILAAAGGDGATRKALRSTVRLQGSLLLSRTSHSCRGPFNGMASRCSFWRSAVSMSFNWRRRQRPSRSPMRSDTRCGSFAFRRGPMPSPAMGLAQPAIACWRGYWKTKRSQPIPTTRLRWADAIRERDAVYGRPIMVAPDSGWGPASKVGDILLARHPRVSRLNDKEYEAWLAAGRGWHAPARRCGHRSIRNSAMPFDSKPTH